MAWAYAAPLGIEAAIRNRVFDVLDGKPKTLDEVAESTHRSKRGLSALMDMLVGLELLAKTPDGKFTLTPESGSFLVSTKPGFVGGIFRHMSTHLIPRWLNLPEIVRTGEPAQKLEAGEDAAPFFADFVEDIAALSYPAAQTLARSLNIAKDDRSLSVLDLGAGSAVWSIALAEASPRVRVTCVDFPAVLDVTRRNAARHGLTERFKFVSGDLLEANFGTNHDLALLGHVLHSIGERSSRILLKRTFEALRPGGTVAIAEFLVNQDRSGPPGGLIFGVNMLINTSEGGTYSFEEIRGWLQDAGFENARTFEAPGPSPLILADRPDGRK